MGMIMMMVIKKNNKLNLLHLDNQHPRPLPPPPPRPASFTLPSDTHSGGEWHTVRYDDTQRTHSEYMDNMNGFYTTEKCYALQDLPALHSGRSREPATRP